KGAQGPEREDMGPPAERGPEPGLHPALRRRLPGGRARPGGPTARTHRRPAGARATPSGRAARIRGRETTTHFRERADSTFKQQIAPSNGRFAPISSYQPARLTRSPTRCTDGFAIRVLGG